MAKAQPSLKEYIERRKILNGYLSRSEKFQTRRAPDAKEKAKITRLWSEISGPLSEAQKYATYKPTSKGGKEAARELTDQKSKGWEKFIMPSFPKEVQGKIRYQPQKADLESIKIGTEPGKPEPKRRVIPLNIVEAIREELSEGTDCGFKVVRSAVRLRLEEIFSQQRIKPGSLYAFGGRHEHTKFLSADMEDILDILENEIIELIDQSAGDQGLENWQKAEDFLRYLIIFELPPQENVSSFLRARNRAKQRGRKKKK